MNFALRLPFPWLSILYIYTAPMHFLASEVPSEAEAPFTWHVKAGLLLSFLCVAVLFECDLKKQSKKKLEDKLEPIVFHLPKECQTLDLLSHES